MKFSFDPQIFFRIFFYDQDQDQDQDDERFHFQLFL